MITRPGAASFRRVDAVPRIVAAFTSESLLDFAGIRSQEGDAYYLQFREVRVNSYWRKFPIRKYKSGGPLLASERRV